MDKDHFLSLVSSTELQRDSLQSLSCRRYEAHAASTTLKYTQHFLHDVQSKRKATYAGIEFVFLCFLQLKQFKEDNLHVGFGSGIMALEQAIEKTKANIQWVAENKVHVMNWLTEESR